MNGSSMQSSQGVTQCCEEGSTPKGALDTKKEQGIKKNLSQLK